MITEEGNQSILETIAAINAETQKWVEAAPNRWAGMLESDLKHWHECGVFTGAQLDHYLAVCDAWEMHRSTFGYKANWTAMMALTPDELAAEVARIQLVIDSEAAWEDKRRQKAEEHQAWVDEHVRFDDEAEERPIVGLAAAFELACA